MNDDKHCKCGETIRIWHLSDGGCRNCGKPIPERERICAFIDLNEKAEKHDVLIARISQLEQEKEAAMVVLQWIFDDGEGGSYRSNIQEVLIKGRKS